MLNTTLLNPADIAKIAVVAFVAVIGYNMLVTKLGKDQFKI